MMPSPYILHLRPLSERIFFLHIPKCAGISFFKALAACYGLSAIFRPRTVTYLDANATVRAARVLNEDVNTYRERLLTYFMEDPRCLCLGGHFPFSERVFNVYSSHWQFVTILRSPVPLWFSHYAYFMKNVSPAHPWHPYAALNVHEFLDTPAAASMGGSYVNVLGRHDDLGENVGTNGVTLALERLERFHLVGTVEDLSGFATRFRHRFNAKLHIPHVNRASPTDIRRACSDPAVLAKVRQLCYPNQHVYDKARSRTRSL